MRNKELYELKDCFLEEWPIERLKSLTLEEYTNLEHNSFCYWVEQKTDELGGISGGSSFKFGIYKRRDLNSSSEKKTLKSDGDYGWHSKYGETKEEVFSTVKHIIIQIAEASADNDFNKIEELEFSHAYKWKIAFLYNDYNMITIYNHDVLKNLAVDIGYAGDTNSYSEMNKHLLDQKGDIDFYDYTQRLWYKHMLDHSQVENYTEKYKKLIIDNEDYDELYKWDSIQHFQDNWINEFDEETIINNLENAFDKESNNLWSGSHYLPLKAIKEFAVLDPSKVAEMFQILFDESAELKTRLLSFETEAEGLKAQLYKDKPNNDHYQSKRAMMMYLSLRYPSKYYIYQNSIFNDFCKISEFTKAPGKSDKLKYDIIDDFNKVCEAINCYLSKDEELLNLHKSRLSSHINFQDNNNVLTQDFIRSVSQYLDIMLRTKDEDLLIKILKESGKEDATCFYSLCDMMTKSLNLYEEDERVMYNLPKSKSDRLGITIGSRYCLQLYSKNHEERWGFIDTENATKTEDWYMMVNTYSEVVDQMPLIIRCCLKELDRTSRTQYLDHNSEALEHSIFDIAYRKALFKTAFDENYDPQNIITATSLNTKSNKMNHSLNTIMYGPPGTGKTYNTINKAIEIVDNDFFNHHNGDNEKDRHALKERFRELLMDNDANGKIAFTTFHQSFSYEDFVEGIKPQAPENEGEGVSYKIEDGVFRKVCVEAAFSIARKDNSNSTGKLLDFSEAYNELIDEINEAIGLSNEFELTTKSGGILTVDGVSSQGNIIIRHKDKDRTYTGSKARLLKLHKGIPDLKKVKNLQTSFRQIIGGNNATVNWALLTELRNRLKTTKQETPVNRTFDYEEKKEIVDSMSNNDFKKNHGEPIVLIIDEINRGNVSAIFGELITLIEGDKRAGNSEALSATLPYSKESFSVPPNLHILGTMNTADRSVEALDTALRRRFSFIEMPPIPELIKSAGKAIDGKVSGIDLVELLRVINKRLERLLDKDHMIGHSGFLHVESLRDLKETFQNNILPLLQEYFYGDYGKIGLVLGDNFFEKQNNSNIDDDNFFASFREYDDSPLLEKQVYHLKNVTDMSDGPFSQALRNLLGKED